MQKLQTAQALASLIGPRPRTRKVVLCHGVFDVIHPGHIRHLTYAKSKADILIASVTCDSQVRKGQYRPHCPQELRAQALACLEMVDFVMIDNDATPLTSIKLLQPDLYAKGYEYQERTISEVGAVQQYGGTMLYTPGDVVFSSSKMLDREQPKLLLEKLAMLDISWDLPDWRGLRVHVVGDTIVDTITRCVPLGFNAKTPTLSVQYESVENFVGGAGVVARHLAAAGASVIFSTVLGDDEAGKFVRDNLPGIQLKDIVDPTRPTTRKNVITSDGYRLLKVDQLDNRAVSDPIIYKLVMQIKRTVCKGVIFSDFRHGIFNRGSIPHLTKAVLSDVMKVADSQVASRWGNILEFNGFDMITPNEKEARFALGDQDSNIRRLAWDIYSVAKCKTLMMKLGSRGMLAQVNDQAEVIVLDSFARNVVDPVGAGDAFLAYATLGIFTGSVEKAAVLGSIAAALECEHEGNVPITADMMRERLNETRALLSR